MNVNTRRFISGTCPQTANDRASPSTREPEVKMSTNGGRMYQY